MYSTEHQIHNSRSLPCNIITNMCGFRFMSHNISKKSDKGHFFFCRDSPPPPSGPWPPHSRGLYYHKQRRATVGRTLLDEGSARRRDLYLHNNHNRQTSLPPVGFEPTVSAGERPQTCSLDHMATGSRDKGYC